MSESAGARPPKGRVRRAVGRVVRLALVVYVAWCAVLWFVQTELLFPARLAAATMTAGADVDAAIPGVERLWITTPGGERVEGWLVAPDEPPPSGRAPAVIVFHGNAETIDHSIGHAEMYAALGWAVLLPEYRGYGRSGGSPSQAAIAEDMRAFYDLLAARPEIDPSRIVFHGRSVGTGVACDLARSRPPAGLILESPFTSVASFCWGYGVPSVLCRHPFRNDRVVRGFPGPVLVMHGSEDEIIPVEHGRRLAAIANDATLVEMPAGHNDFPPDWGRYEEAIRTFLGRIGGPPPGP